MTPIITFLTDFGRQDGYVAAMHGVALSICPRATLVDVTHEIPPQNIQIAGFVLYQMFDYFPPHTVHCVIVDPGVGSERRAIAIQTNHGVFVGPDNGVFSLVTQVTKIQQLITLNNPTYQLPQTSHTFHGRTIFTPAAAHIANNVPVTELGHPLTNWVVLPKILATGDTCQIIHIDHFGNLFLNLTAENIFDPDQLYFNVKGHRIGPLRQTFADVPIGELVTYVGSTRNHVEIARRNGNAAQMLNVQIGDTLSIISPH